MNPTKPCEKCRTNSSLLVILGVAALNLAACADGSMQSGHDFVVEADGATVSVHVTGTEVGASPAELDTMIKSGVTCGLQRAESSHTVVTSGRNIKMTWSANGQVRPELSSVNVRLTGDNLPVETAMERISLRQAPRPMFVRAVCDLTAESLADLRRDVSARTASGAALPSR